MFPGPDSSVVHPGIFPISLEAQEFATPEEWLSFNVEAGWGTEQFENSIPQDTKFPGIWADPEERKAVREIIDQQLALLAENRDRATTLVALANMCYTYQGRDGKTGMSIDDVMINFHGSQEQTRLGSAIKSIMEPNLKYKSDKDVILKWIQAGAEEPEYNDHIASI